MTLLRAFARAQRAQLSARDLHDAGISRARIRRAVEAGYLRAGVLGYWIPRAADPGTIAVMRAALSTVDESEATES